MHDSLIPEFAAALAEPLPPPPCPIIDAHMHVFSAGSGNDRYARAAKAYGIDRAVALAHETEPEELARKGFFLPCAWPGLPQEDDGEDWIRRERERIEDWKARGAVAIKYRLSPDRPSAPFDDARLLRVFETAAAADMPVMAHLGQPSRWWGTRFDPTLVGPKEQYALQFERVLQAVPELTVIGAHMACWPEEPQRLRVMLERYPNFYLDTSATKWIVRELSRRRDEARALFLDFPDRILFGSDLVTRMDQGENDYYTSRFHVQRTMWEGTEETPSMIADPDAVEPDFPRGARIRALALPPEVLRKLYRENAARVYGIDA